jgi:hypothetical protein
MNAPKPADSASIDNILAALYETISGPAGVERDWDRFRDLFYPGTRLLRTMAEPNAEYKMAAMEVESFIELAQPFFKTQSFYEREIWRRLDRFGQMAQVFSAYAASAQPEGGSDLGRGINSIQLWSDGRRWWVMSMLWDDERPGQPIPAEYLP